MPKVVDVRERRERVADAVLDLIARDGLRAATLSNVAARTGLAIGSVRHYFDGSAELLVFTVQELGRRLTARAQEHAALIATSLTAAGSRAERRQRCADLLGEWLPLDEPRRREAALRHTFAVAARTDPLLRPHAAVLRTQLSTIVHRVLTEARRTGGVPSTIDIDLETDRLAALIDGMSTDPQPDPDRLRAVLDRHLRQLATA